MTRFLHVAIFIAGLAAVAWVGAGYVGSNPLALAITGLVGAFYLVGALELRRFHQATATLTQAVADAAQAPAHLGEWLARLHPSLQNAVRLRVEGERVALPGPALTPYLSGLLVLLGMLGTFVGMVVTLKGTGIALESATDLPSIRDSLSAPVRGLGLAFGTSVAGVAASAMLGLLAALCRRERLKAGQRLDARIATTLRVFSSVHQREESFKLLQLQAQLMPQLLDRLDTWMATQAQQDQALGERLAAGQERFHTQAEAAYTGLAASVDRSLQHSLTESARMAGEALQPVVEATMAGLARETAALQASLGHHVQQHLAGVSTRLEASTATVTGLWHEAVAEQQRSNQALSQDLRSTLDGFAQSFGRSTTTLVDGVSTRLDQTASGVADTWRDAMAQQAHSQAALTNDTHQALAAAAAGFAQHAASLQHTVAQSHTDWQTRQTAHDEQRLAAWTQSLEGMAGALRQEWQQAGTQTTAQLQELARSLAQTAGEASAQAEAHAKNTLAEVARLVQAASEAPRAAAEMVTELRQKLSDSMVRDNAMLEERSRILETLATLLDAVNHASREQRSAIDALVTGSADLMERVGQRFTQTLDTHTGTLANSAAQITGSAAEVASLGEAFGLAVQLFSQSNEQLVAQLQRIEAALGQSLARSDEQLDYYVAQAREVIDLSIGAQRQIVDDLQQLAHRQAAAASTSEA